jgi:OmcA/MtrC family decaheme c-type cytochrome
MDAPEPATPDELAPTDDPPGIALEVLGLRGASGAGGNFQVGDRITVDFRAKKDDGTDWRASELDLGRILVSGPTFNYQRVLPELRDVHTAAVTNADGSLSYTYPDPIPATYLAPLNDTASFGPLDGELTGEPLLGGTYTVGLYVGWDYSVDGESFRDIANTTVDFPLGNAGALAPRAVVSLENCNQCHSTLQAHGGSRQDVTLCLLCHTSGSEDRNVASAAGGTPGASIEFATMIHKIHSGATLPSVLGVATHPDGSRNYAATPQPYELVGFNDSVIDFSHVRFPVWPNLTSPLPRDAGYSGLGSDEQALENLIRGGVASCHVCHGDPDGTGPLVAPDQGQLALSQPSRNACGACHDDVHWDLPYEANSSIMPAQNDDSACILCHSPSGDALAVFDAHQHPQLLPSFNPGLAFGVTDVEEAGASDGDGTLDPGEKLAFTLTVQDDSGADVDPAGLAGLTVVFSGPTTNSNLVSFVDFPRAALTGAQPYSVRMPERVQLEYVGDSSGSNGDVFATARAPHWNVTSAVTEVRVATLAGGTSSLAAPTAERQNYVDVMDGGQFARDDYVVLDRGGANEEYLRIQHVEGNRLWFSSPTTTGYPTGPTAVHAQGTPVDEVTLALLVNPVDYTIDAATGTIEELAEFGAGKAVVVTYTTDFVVPDVYPVAINGSPDLDETAGEWSGKSLVDGTYVLTVYGSKSLTLTEHGESNTYRATDSTGVEVLVGSAGMLEPYDKISSAETCYACHQDLLFHGGGRGGFDACIACHGTAGAEDRPQYVAGNAPATTGVAIDFREMVHKIHRGRDLANASTYTVVGFGSTAYPDNYTPHHYDEVGFPAMPAGTMECAKCHGTSDSWTDPAPRGHPTEQVQPALVFGPACASCHDSDAARAHIEINTAASGFESCAICHSADDELGVETVHKVR